MLCNTERFVPNARVPPAESPVRMIFGDLIPFKELEYISRRFI